MAEEVEAKAKEMGWAPREEWRGPEEKWVDAETFVRRGEEILPILRANNKRYSDELAALRAKDTEREQQLREARESIDALKEIGETIKKDKMERQRAEIAAKIKTAREEGDVDAELAASEEFSRVQRETEKPPVKEARETHEAPVMSPEQKAEFDGWKRDNPWFDTDTIRAANMNIVGAELRKRGETLTGRAFLDKVTQEVNNLLGPPGGETFDRVSGGRPSGGDGNSGKKGKSYSDLPEDARVACDRDARRLVGPNKAFKTDQEWRNHYIKMYFEE